MVGCSNSSESTGQTLPDRPMGLASPNLTALSPSSIQATWQPPANPNGVILRFELQRLFGPGRNQSEVIFSGLNFEATISGLTPNTLYSFQLLAFNAGGSVTSPVAEERTLEDIPDGIMAPDIEIVNSTALRATWQDPLEPNGDIISYNLIQNGTVVFSGVAQSYLATNLEPFTFYSYSIMACTVRGCGSSNQSNVRTPEDVPEGYIEPTVAMVTAESITLMVHPVSSPNGVVRYVLYILGQFNVASAGINDTAVEMRVVYNSSEPGMVEIQDLLPFSSYEFTLSVSNSAGELAGDPFIVRTEAAGECGGWGDEGVTGVGKGVRDVKISMPLLFFWYSLYRRARTHIHTHAHTQLLWVFLLPWLPCITMQQPSVSSGPRPPSQMDPSSTTNSPSPTSQTHLSSEWTSMSPSLLETFVRSPTMKSSSQLSILSAVLLVLALTSAQGRQVSIDTNVKFLYARTHVCVCPLHSHSS